MYSNLTLQAKSLAYNSSLAKRILSSMHILDNLNCENNPGCLFTAKHLGCSHARQSVGWLRNRTESHGLATVATKDLTVTQQYNESLRSAAGCCPAHSPSRPKAAQMKFFLIVLKNVRRNLLRTTLTSLGTMVLVFVVTLVWSVLGFLSAATSEKSNNFKAIISERWQIPSQMPFAYAARLSEGAPRHPGDLKIAPEDSMTWQFYGGSLEREQAKRTLDNGLFFFAMDPTRILTMMDELDSLPPAKAQALAAPIRKMQENRQGVIIGRDRLARLKKQVGDRFTLFGGNYKDINLEFEVVGTFPEGTRYDLSAIMNRDYLNAALDDYERANKGKKHPLAAKSLNLVWLRVPDKAAFNKLAAQITSSPEFQAPAVKCETASSGISTFLEAYKDIFWAMRWFLAPAILITLSLVIANAISISVRERRMEIAVLKVLGFQPGHILGLVLAEAVLIGTTAGLASATLTYFVITVWMGGLKFPIAFFSSFFIPPDAVWWGLAVGAATAFLGSVVPAWSARSVKVADVFSKVA